MSVEQMREYLSKLYGPSWAERVRKMSDKQVYAVYQRHISTPQKRNK